LCHIRRLTVSNFAGRNPVVCRRCCQILSKMDGLVNLENVLVVGMTNRKELLDDALLRPGRMEVRHQEQAKTQLAASSNSPLVAME